MELYLLRHAIAVERGTPGYTDDSRRPLTSDGRRKMEQNALGMKAMGLSFDLLFTSPYVRARQTAAIAARTLNIKAAAIIQTEHLIPGAPYAELLKEINAVAPKPVRLLLVGHEPHMSGLICFLLSAARPFPITLKKGGLCHVSVSHLAGAGCGTLNSLLSPAQLRLMA